MIDIGHIDIVVLIIELFGWRAKGGMVLIFSSLKFLLPDSVERVLEPRRFFVTWVNMLKSAPCGLLVALA